MYVRVKSAESAEWHVIPVARSTSVERLKLLVREKFAVEPDRQRLFFAGKQLENQYNLYDYKININDVIQLLVEDVDKKSEANKKSKKETRSNSSPSTSSSYLNNSKEINEKSKYFKVGDYVDVRDFQYGSWFMGKLVKIKKDTLTGNVLQNPFSSVQNDGLLYLVEFVKCPQEYPTAVHLQDIRPLASEILPLNKLKPGDRVLMNYNDVYLKERGYWYDVLVKKVIITKKKRAVVGDVSIGIDYAVKANCNLIFLDDIHKIKPLKLLSKRTRKEDKVMQTQNTVTRADPLSCIECKDNIKISCKGCGCSICGGKKNEDKQIICDECHKAFHLMCLKSPLKKIPKNDWYCQSCKNDETEIVKVGEKLKTPKKNTSNKEWGNGMSCVGRTKLCSVVPANHFGSIPGIEVGTTWAYRVQVSEAGVHRPMIGGIHGRINQGAFSIVLSGGYEDDVDNGNEFTYTGSGGRDLSCNKRTAQQSSDQKLTRLNRALAFNCDAEIDDENGAVAKNWKLGKPVRVIRSYRSKHSKYAPEFGNRYDGLYKVKRYFKIIGQAGFYIWRFVLQRDDPSPAPWTKEGKKRIAQLGLEIIYPENYNLAFSSNETMSKLKLNNSSEIDDHQSPRKKVKMQYTLEAEILNMIKADIANKKYWEDCKKLLEEGKKAFLDKVEETFTCLCCQEIVSDPITTKCSHNICKECLTRSFAVQVFQCPSCRAGLKNLKPMKINNKLKNALLYLFPNYDKD